MRVDLARHQHQQHSNTNPNHYVNAPFSVPQSVASNYHLVSDPNGNPIGTESDIHGSDSASSSAASSFVHLPLATVDNISARSMLVRGGYDNVSLFLLLLKSVCAHYSLWDHLLTFMDERSLVSCPPFTIQPVIFAPRFYHHQLLIIFFLFLLERCPHS